MRGVPKSSVAVLLAVTLALLVCSVGAAAPLRLQAESGINLNEPKLALTKFAGLFVRDFVTQANEDLLQITVENPNESSVNGRFRLELLFGGRQLGFVETYPVPLPPGESVWNLRTGGIDNELIVDVINHVENELSGEEIAHEIKNAFDWGSITEWKLSNWWGDEPWFKEHILDWDNIGDLDETGILDLIEQVRALQFPAGGYTLVVSLRFTDPDSGTTVERESRLAWQVTNPEPVSIVYPDDQALGYPVDGIDPDELEFTWMMPELPGGFGVNSVLSIRDSVTGRTETVDILHSDFDFNGEFTYGDDPGEILPELLTGRRYTWSVDVRGTLSKRTIGGVVPSASFWMVNEAPTVEITPSALNFIAGDRLTVNATYSDDGDLTNSLAVRWFVNDELVASGVNRINYTFPADLESDTEYVVRLEVTDSFGAVGEAEVTAFVAANQPPVLSIVAPEDGGVYRLGDVISFEAGAVSDPEGEGLRRVEWYVTAANAEADGRRIGAGESLDFRLGNPGERKVTLLAEDVRGAISRETVVITVAANQAPDVTITSPEDGRYEIGTELELDATVTDDFDPVGSDFNLRFEVNGELVEGTSITLDRVGAYRIRALATDSNGAVGSAQVVVQAVSEQAAQAPQNESPTVTLSDVPSELRLGQSVVLSATASDSDGEIDRIEWLINGRPAPAGLVSGDGSELDLSGLGVGNHNIIVTAIDNIGAVGSASVNVTVVRNQAPTFTISGLAPRYVVGDTVELSFEVSDPDGDEIDGEATWRVVGPGGVEVASGSGNGGNVSFVVGSAGSHSVALRAVDSLGLAGTRSASFTVAENSVPNVRIQSPTSGTVVTQGESVLFSVRISDADNDEITGVLVNGEALGEFSQEGDVVAFARALDNLGPNSVIVSATDARGGVGSASVALIAVAAELETGVENTPPSVTLSGPSDVNVPFGVVQSFQAVVTDPDTERDESPDQVSVAWLVNGEAVGLTTEAPYVLEHAFTQEGENTVEAVAVDQRGATTRAAVALTVDANLPPTISITTPAPQAELPYDEPVELAATVTDPEGHVTQVTWLLGGTPIASGAQTTGAITLPGAQRLTARVTDAYGATNEASVQVNVAAPEGETLPPVIVEPQENQIVIADTDLTFAAANVPADATVVWRSSVTGEIAGELITSEDGIMQLLANLEEGEHVVALLVDGVQRDQVTVFAVGVEAQSVAPQGVGVVLLFEDVDGSGIEVRRGGGQNTPLVTTLRTDDDLGFELEPGQFIWLDPGESVTIMFYDAGLAEDVVTVEQPADAAEALRVNVAQLAGTE